MGRREKGKYIVLAVIVTLIAIELLQIGMNFVFSLGDPIKPLVRMIIALPFLILTFLGHRWAGILIGVLAGLGILMSAAFAVLAFSNGNLLGSIGILVVLLPFCFIVWALIFSENVKLYMEDKRNN